MSLIKHLKILQKVGYCFQFRLINKRTVEIELQSTIYIVRRQNAEGFGTWINKIDELVKRR